MTLKHELEIQYLVRSGLYVDQDAVWRNALNALFVLHPEQKLQMVITAYQMGDLSLGKAAEIMGLASEEIKDTFIKAGVQIHLGPENADELGEELNAFQAT